MESRNGQATADIGPISAAAANGRALAQRPTSTAMRHAAAGDSDRANVAGYLAAAGLADDGGDGTRRATVAAVKK